MKFEDMDVWKYSSRLATDILKMTENMRHFGFRDQITRSSLSVPSNISEGSERSSTKELLQFLSYAKGSCGELRTQLYIGMEAGLLNREQTKNHLETTRRISAMLHSLIHSIRKRLQDKKTRWNRENKNREEDKKSEEGE